jgi:hypothetical protein
MAWKTILSASVLACAAAAVIIGRFIPAGAVAARTGKSADFRLLAGAASVVPIAVEAGAATIEVRIDGRGPIPMIFDTGAENTLTPETATALGLETHDSGSVWDSGGNRLSAADTMVRTLRIGDAEMTDQPLAVVALPRYLTDRGKRAPIAGIIGYQLLVRFAARLDYQSRTLTLMPERDFRYSGKGVRVPIVFNGKTPAAPAATDGISGMFVIDTGSVGALTLRRSFVEKHGIAARHPSAVRIKSIGASGPFEMLLTRLGWLDLADSRIERPATRYPATGNEGLPFDGSIGYEILRQFVITFDYAHRELWFERSKAFGTRTGQGSAGFQAVPTDGGGFKVITVLPSTAAAQAGIQVGDLIAAIDGASTRPMSLSDFAMRMRQPPGAVVILDVERGGNRRSVSLTLKDVLP